MTEETVGDMLKEIPNVGDVTFRDGYRIEMKGKWPMSKTPDDWLPLCRSDAEFRALMREADRQCAAVLRHRHGRNIGHCVVGLTEAEKIKAAEWHREWTPDMGWIHQRGGSDRG